MLKKFDLLHVCIWTDGSEVEFSLAVDGPIAIPEIVFFILIFKLYQQHKTY